jgi:hypothetical protein
VHPGGIKDRYFVGVPREAQVASYRDAVREIAPGTSLVIDYRERGLEGIRIAREALEGSNGPKVRVLGRPFCDDPVDEIARTSDGLGIPSLSVADRSHRDIVRRVGGLYSIHASELYHEDIGDVLEMEPDLIVHLVKGTEDDRREVARNGIPVCVCPRANAAFRIPVPLHGMVSDGLRIVLGTDNALAARQDMWREMEAAWLLLRNGGMGGSEAARTVFEMASGRTIAGTYLGGSVLGRSPWWEGDWPHIGEKARLSILRIPGGDWWMERPFDLLVRFTGKDDVIGPDLVGESKAGQRSGVVHAR